jgi:hypothetical protein
MKRISRHILSLTRHPLVLGAVVGTCIALVAIDRQFILGTGAG